MLRMRYPEILRDFSTHPVQPFDLICDGVLSILVRLDRRRRVAKIDLRAGQTFPVSAAADRSSQSQSRLREQVCSRADRKQQYDAGRRERFGYAGKPNPAQPPGLFPEARIRRWYGSTLQTWPADKPIVESQIEFILFGRGRAKNRREQRSPFAWLLGKPSMRSQRNDQILRRDVLFGADVIPGEP